MNLDYNYSYKWDVKYWYPNSFVLRNKLNIENSEELNNAELEYTSLAISEIKNNPIKGDFNLRHLQNIHKHVFADIYEWAGELRTVNISKGNAFCNYIYLADVSSDIFSKLKEENYLIGMHEKNIYYKLAYYLGEVNPSPISYFTFSIVPSLILHTWSDSSAISISWVTMITQNPW